MVCYAVMFKEPETGVTFISAFGANIGDSYPRDRAWNFMRECERNGVDAGFPFEIDTNGKPLTLADMLKMEGV
jgi:hypothetical protein